MLTSSDQWWTTIVHSSTTKWAPIIVIEDSFASYLIFLLPPNQSIDHCFLSPRMITCLTFVRHHRTLLFLIRPQLLALLHSISFEARLHGPRVLKHNSMYWLKINIRIEPWVYSLAVVMHRVRDFSCSLATSNEEGDSDDRISIVFNDRSVSWRVHRCHVNRSSRRVPSRWMAKSQQHHPTMRLNLVEKDASSRRINTSAIG